MESIFLPSPIAQTQLNNDSAANPGKDFEVTKSWPIPRSEGSYCGSRGFQWFLGTVMATLYLVLSTSPATSWGQESSWPFQHHEAPFHLHSDRLISDLPRLVEEMSRLKEELSIQLGTRPEVECVHIVLMSNEQEYQRYIQHYFPQVPSRRALFIKDRGPGIVFAFRHSDFRTDLRHECTHALLQHDFPKIPLWLDEGLAEYFEVVGGARRYHATHAPMIKWQVRLGHAPGMEELERCLSPKDMDSRRYSEAWSWVHFLLESNEDGRQVLQGYLKDIHDFGERAGDLSTRVHQSLPQWRQDYLAHFKSLEDPNKETLVTRASTNKD